LFAFCINFFVGNTDKLKLVIWQNCQSNLTKIIHMHKLKILAIIYSMKTNKQKIISYVAVIASILLVAVLGSVFVNLGMDWFGSLETPSRFVPSFIIPIVWTVIYSIFAIVLCNWTSKENLPKSTLILLIINGILNILWCLFFFTFNNTLLGNIFIVLLLISAWLLVADIYTKKPNFALFTLIYPVWASIATTLNLALWILN